MKISVIGLGKLGLPIACIMASKYEVVGIDSNKEVVEKLKSGICPIKETNLDTWFKGHHKFMKFTSRYTDLGEISFLIVPTPSEENKFSSRFIEEVLDHINKKHTVVIISTVYPGETKRLQKKYKHINIIYSPTFVALGSVIWNFMHPDFILIGADKPKDVTKVLEIYKQVRHFNNYFILSSLEAEIAKLALNCYVTTKITFANQIGNLCYRLGIKPDNILNAIANDERIGHTAFKAGLPFGGPCFPRDIKAMERFFKENNLDQFFLGAINYMNEAHLVECFNRIDDAKPRGSTWVKDYTVGFKSLSYKSGTDNTECSALKKLYDMCKESGHKVKIGKGDVNLDWSGIVEDKCES
jgi:UDPglucose 6-dehydrogenase